MYKWIVEKKLGWSANCWPSQPKFYPTIHFQSTIHFQLQFTCTWSGPWCNLMWPVLQNFLIALFFSIFRVLCCSSTLSEMALGKLWGQKAAYTIKSIILSILDGCDPIFFVLNFLFKIVYIAFHPPTHTLFLKVSVLHIHTCAVVRQQLVPNYS